MKRFCVMVVGLIFVTIALGEGERKVEFTVKHPNAEEPVFLEALFPEGWKLNPYFGTVVYQPGNADDFYEPPMIEFQARCEGECRPEAISVNLADDFLGDPATAGKLCELSERTCL